MIAIVSKELSRLLKRSSVLAVLIISPFAISALTILFYINLDVKSMNIGILNLDRDERSILTVTFLMRFFKGAYLEKVNRSNYLQKLINGDLEAVLVIPDGFMEKVYARKKSEVWYIPSPHDLQLSIGAYSILKSLFEDLAGGIFVDMGATKSMGGSCIRRMLFSYKRYPPPEFISKKPIVEGEFPPPSVVFWKPPESEKLDFDVLMSPAVILLSGVLAILTLSIHSVIDDRERGLLEIYKVGNVNSYLYAISNILVYTLIGILASSMSYVIAYFMSRTLINPLIRIPLISLISLIYASLGFIISVYSPNRSTANLLMIFFITISILASGNFVAISQMPKFSRSLVMASPIYNANMIFRKELLFLGAKISKELTNTVIWGVVFFISAVLSGRYAFRR